MASKIRFFGMTCAVALLAITGFLLLPEFHASDNAVASSATLGSLTEKIARGSYLTRIGNCALCHTARGADSYAGGRSIVTPFGTVFSSNLTPDTRFGIGAWTASDFWRALHHGQSKDGRLLSPAFPYTSYTHVTRDDSDAIWAFLQTVKPSAQPPIAHAMAWPFGTQFALKTWRTLYFAPGSGPTPARGEYLVRGLGHCYECHGQRNALGALTSASPDRGGVLPGSTWYAPSLRMASEASVARWDQAAIVRFLKTGMSGTSWAGGPMTEVVTHGTQYLSDGDAAAVAAFLRDQGLDTAVATPLAIPPSPSTVPNAKSAQSYKALYEKHCADCHGKQGEGESGAYPALAGNRALNMVNINNLVLKLMYGGFSPTSVASPRPFGMPPFMLTLNDMEMAGVVTYIRTSWGNTGASINEFDINKLRSSLTP